MAPPFDPQLSNESRTHTGRQRDYLNPDHDPFQSFLLEPGEPKATATPHPTVPNTTLFTFNKEDHTLGALLVPALLRLPEVVFAAYRVPHPLYPVVELRLQVVPGADAVELLVKTCETLVMELEGARMVLRNNWALWEGREEEVARVGAELRREEGAEEGGMEGVEVSGDGEVGAGGESGEAAAEMWLQQQFGGS